MDYGSPQSRERVYIWACHITSDPVDKPVETPRWFTDIGRILGAMRTEPLPLYWHLLPDSHDRLAEVRRTGNVHREQEHARAILAKPSSSAAFDVDHCDLYPPPPPLYVSIALRTL